MEKTKIFRAVGNKVLSFEADMENEDDKRMVEMFKKAAATHPETIQDLFIRIAEMEKQENRDDDNC